MAMCTIKQTEILSVVFFQVRARPAVLNACYSFSEQECFWLRLWLDFYKKEEDTIPLIPEVVSEVTVPLHLFSTQSKMFNMAGDCE